MIIRQATPQDYEALSILIEQVDVLHRRQLPHIFRKGDDPAKQQDYIMGLLTTENVGVFVAEQNHSLTGFVVVLVRMTPDIPILVPRCYALIENIGVDKSHQKQGIGKALMARAQQFASAKGASSLELTVYEFNQDARAFYEALGYQTESRRMTINLGDKYRENISQEDKT